MLHSITKSRLARSCGGLTFLGAAGLALAALLPGAWQSVSQAAPRIESTPRIAAAASTASLSPYAESPSLLDQWSDTADLTPEQEELLAHHRLVENNRLARQIKLDRLYTLRAIKKLSRAQQRRIVLAMYQFHQQERLLLRVHWALERASGSPIAFTVPRFRL